MADVKKIAEETWLDSLACFVDRRQKELKSQESSDRQKKEEALAAIYRGNINFLTLQTCNEIQKILQWTNAKREQLRKDYSATLNMLADYDSSKEKGND